ncbi:MAG: lipoyl(octanoyl) transferase LipB [Bacteroidia bacterium]
MIYPKPNREVQIINKGLMPYREAWQFQELLFDKIVEIKLANRNRDEQVKTPNYLIFCEHPAVYTLGKSGTEDNLLLSKPQLDELGIEYFKTNRGGDITHHAPGQIVMYPVLDLENFFTDIHLYLRNLEEAVIRTLKEFGIESGRYPGYTGVWIHADRDDARKICAMGVRCSRWVSMHGIALNVNNDLSLFNHIVPCGIRDKDVSSMQTELGNNQNMSSVIDKLAAHFAEVFEARYI